MLYNRMVIYRDYISFFVYCQYILLVIWKGYLAMAYYRRIREMREDHDLTQKALAEMLGMKQPQYFRYEQGYRDIPTDILIKLADLYGTTTDYLLGRTDNPKTL